MLFISLWLISDGDGRRTPFHHWAQFLAVTASWSPVPTVVASCFCQSQHLEFSRLPFRSRIIGVWTVVQVSCPFWLVEASCIRSGNDAVRNPSEREHSCFRCAEMNQSVTVFTRVLDAPFSPRNFASKVTVRFLHGYENMTLLFQ